MPAGVSWPRYLAFTSAALFSMFIGSQIVHTYYNPLKDMEDYIELELKRAQQRDNEES